MTLRKPRPAAASTPLPSLERVALALAVGSVAVAGCGDRLEDPPPQAQSSGGQTVQIAVQVAPSYTVTAPAPQVVYVRPPPPVVYATPPRIVYLPPSEPAQRPVHVYLPNTTPGPVVVPQPPIETDPVPHVLPGAPRAVLPPPPPPMNVRGGAARVSTHPTTRDG